MPHSRADFSKATTRRPGTVYLSVLGVTLIVATTAAVSMSVVRLERRSDVAQSKRQEASLLARSAVEYAINWIDNVDNWRDILTSGQETPAYDVGDNTVRWRLTDADGDLDDDDWDRVDVSGIAQVGEVVVVKTVTLQPRPLSCLEVALHVNNHLMLETDGILPKFELLTNQTVSSNDDVVANSNGAKIYGDAEAVSDVFGTVTGTKTEGIVPREMPGIPCNDYLAMGTRIDIDSLDSGQDSNWREIREVVLSPTNNPYGSGTTNPAGIYYIECNSKHIRIESARIHGTLVLLNNGDKTGLYDKVSLESYHEAYPVLVVEKKLVSEYSIGWIGGLLDILGGSYPNEVRGLVYVGDEFLVAGDHGRSFDGVVVAERFLTDKNFNPTRATFNYNDIHWSQPPPGFGDPTEMQVVPGTWRTEAYSY